MSILTDVPATDPLEIYRARDAIYAVDLLYRSDRPPELFQLAR
jgi:hypothetical protein